MTSLTAAILPLTKRQLPLESLTIYLFKASFRPFVDLLEEQGLNYSLPPQRPGILAAPSGAIEIVQSATMWGSLAYVIIAFLKARHSRKISITMKDREIISISGENLTHKELVGIIEHAKTITAIETKSEDSDNIQSIRGRMPI